MSGKYKRSRQLLLGAVSTVAMLALTSTAALATPTNIPVWQSGGSMLSWGAPSEASGKSITGLNLRYLSYGGVPIWVTCESLTASGKVENPGAGKPGTVTSISSPTSGPSGTFKGCQLVEYAGKELRDNSLDCTIPKELPMESAVGTLTNKVSPAGGLELKTYLKTFTVQCPQFQANWSFTITGTGKELWAGDKNLEGEEYFSPESTKVEGSFGGTGEVEYGLKLVGANGPVTVRQFSYEKPTYGTKWYRGGAGRTGEGPKTLIGEGTPTSLTGGSAALSFDFYSSGIKMVVGCSGGSVTGSVENPLGGGSAVANIGLGLTGCALAKPEGLKCTLTSSSITTKTMPGMVKAGSEAEPILQLNKLSSDEVGSFTVTGCTIGALNHVYKITGQLFARPQLQAGKQLGAWLVPASLNGGYLKIAGQGATTTGEVIAETGGEAVTMG